MTEAADEKQTEVEEAPKPKERSKGVDPTPEESSQAREKLAELLAPHGLTVGGNKNNRRFYSKPPWLVAVSHLRRENKWQLSLVFESDEVEGAEAKFPECEKKQGHKGRINMVIDFADPKAKELLDRHITGHPKLGAYQESKAKKEAEKAERKKKADEAKAAAAAKKAAVDKEKASEAGFAVNFGDSNPEVYVVTVGVDGNLLETAHNLAENAGKITVTEGTILKVNDGSTVQYAQYNAEGQPTVINDPSEENLKLLLQ